MSHAEMIRRILSRMGWTAGQLAERIGASPRSVYRWIETGRPPQSSAIRRNLERLARVVLGETRDGDPPA